MADADNFQKLITPSIKFEIPEYQRNYSWTKEELKDLWRDLNNVIGGSDGESEAKSHFYGMFLFNVDDGIYNIIDGQQRITTAIILLNEIRNRLIELDSEEKATGIKHDYIKNSHGYKLTLGPDDDHRVLQDEILLQANQNTDIESLSDTPSQTRLLKAKKFFSSKLLGNSGRQVLCERVSRR